MRSTIVTLWVGIAALGCGTKGSSAELPPAVAAGDESTADPSDAVPESELPAASRADVGTGPATLTLVARVGGQAVPASVRVLDAQGTVRGEGSAGGPITLPAGSYEIEVTIHDASVMLDTPTQRSKLQVAPGQAAKVEAIFPWSKVTLDVRVGGRSQPGAKVVLLRDGEPVAEMKSGAAPVPITPGRYEADVSLKSTKIRVAGLHFPDSATQTVPVHVKN